MSKSKILIIDFSSIIHQVPMNMRRLTTSDGRKSGHAFCFLRKMKRIQSFNANLIIFALDAGHDARSKENPEYKGSREHSAPIVDDVIPLIENVPSVIMYKQGFEADDVIYTCCRVFQDVSWADEVVVLAKDYDIAHVLTFNGVRHFMTFDDEVNSHSLFMRFGCVPGKLSFFKAIFGDSSDNIKGLKLGKKKKEVVHSFLENKSIQSIFKQLPVLDRKKFFSNLRLTKLKYIPDLVIRDCKWHGDAVESFLADFEIKSIQPSTIRDTFTKDMDTQKRIIKEFKIANK